MKDYENLLLDIIERQNDEKGISNQSVKEFYLDFSKQEHIEFFYAKYGGEDLLKLEFPQLYRQVKATIANAIEIRNNPVIQNEKMLESRGSLKDGVKIRDVVFTQENVGASGLVSLCDKTPRLFISLSILQNNKVVKRERAFYHGIYDAILNCLIPSRPKGSDGYITVIMNATWQDPATNLLKDCSASLKSSIKEEEVVESLELHHPCLYNPCIDPSNLDNPMPDLTFIKEDANEKQPLDKPSKKDEPSTRSSINVCYRRVPKEIEHIDYIYSEERSGGLQKVYLDIRGEVILNPKYKFSSIKNFDIILDCIENGTVEYKSIPKKDIHYYATDRGFNFVLPTCWESLIPDSVMSGNRLYYLEVDISFMVEGSLEEVHINISSRDGLTPLETHMSEIKPIRMFWGCIAEGTKIKMEDRSEKNIESIRAGDRIFSPDGEGTVIDIVRGTDSDMFVIKGKEMQEICATSNHPFKTTRGWVVAKDLCSFFKLIDEEENSVEIQYHYPFEHETVVYNLLLEGVHSFCANGYFVGDNEIQGECARNNYKKTELDFNPEIEAECKKLRNIFE